MGIEVSTRLIHASIAQVLHEISPDAEIFDNPNQQGTPYPAWFIVHRSPVEVRREIRRYYITYYIDVWYLIKQNLTQMFDQYTRIAEQLADKLEYIPVYGYNGVVLHTFETSWSIEMTAMKYSITLRLVCSRENGVPQPKMEVIEDFQTFIKSLGKLKRIRYICSQFPDFDMGLETLQYCTEGNTLVLPFVSGIYRDGDNTRWEPLTWNVGAFGSQYGPVTEDVTIDLEMGVVVGFDVVVGGTVGVGANVGRDIVWRITDMSRDGWHYVGPEHSLATEPVVGGADLSRDEYEPIGPQKSLGPSPVYGGTVEPYDPTPVLPTVTIYSSPSTYCAFNSSGDSVTINAGSSRMVYHWTGNQYTAITYDSAKSYSLISYRNSGTLIGRTGLSCFEYKNPYSPSTYLGVTNVSSQSITVDAFDYATCSDSTATVVTVYDSGNVAYNAFKFTAGGTDYYFVLDGVQTDWTDDLAGIGYRLTPTTKRGYAYYHLDYYGSNYCYLTKTAAGGDYISPNNSKNYVVVAINSTPSFDPSTIKLSNNSSPARLRATCYSPFSGSLWYVDYYEVNK